MHKYYSCKQEFTVTISEENEVCKKESQIAPSQNEVECLKSELALVKLQLSEARHKIKILQQKIHRKEESWNRKNETEKIPKLDIDFILSQLEQHIDNTLMLDMIRRIVYKAKQVPYTEAIKDFAFSQNYYSMKAYEHLRRSFNATANVLPCVRMFLKWTKDINCTPGFLPASISFLEQLSLNSASKLYYVIMIDEIHIRKQVIHDGEGFVGYTDYGGIVENDQEDKIATTALFIMASSINGNYRIPLGYILTNGLKSELVASVILQTLQIMKKTSSIVAAVTFDGLRSNISAVQSLGANLDVESEDFSPTFKDSNTDRKVAVILDACHMMKLLRNLFKHYSVIFNENGEVS